MSQAALPSASQLRWRCRRGMLELDLLLNTFVEIEYTQLSKEDVELFLTLLEYTDQDLLDLLLEKTEAADELMASLVTKIRNTCRN